MPRDIWLLSDQGRLCCACQDVQVREVCRSQPYVLPQPCGGAFGRIWVCNDSSAAASDTQSRDTH